MKPREQPTIKPPWSFALIPSYDADPRSLRGLKRGELACFLAIARCINGTTYEACPSMETIGRIAGTTERHARDYVNSLVDNGWLNREIGGGRSNSNVYTFAVPTSGEPETRPYEGPSIQDENPAQSGHETRPDSDRNPAQFRHKPGHTGGRRTTEQHRTTSNSKTPNATEQPSTGASGVAAAEGAGEELEIDPKTIRELQRFGIAEPALSRLAQTAGITAELVRRIGEDCQRRGKGAPIVIREIEAALQRMAIETQDAANAKTARVKVRQTEAEREARKRNLEAKAEEWANHAPDAELIRLRDELYKSDPRNCPVGYRPEDNPTAGTLRAGMAVPLYLRKLAEQQHGPMASHHVNGNHPTPNPSRGAELVTRPRIAFERHPRPCQPTPQPPTNAPDRPAAVHSASGPGDTIEGNTETAVGIKPSP